MTTETPATTETTDLAQQVRDQAAKDAASRIVVTLADGRTVTVGRLRWASYSTVSRRLMEALRGNQPANAAAPTPAEAEAMGFALDAALDSITPDLVRGSVKDPDFDFDSLEREDVMALRTAALQANPVKDLVAAKMKEMTQFDQVFKF